jgi:hypothetical protein
MGYAVFHISEDASQAGTGLTLAEAFARMMGLAHSDYIFHRIDGVMHLTLHHLDGVPDEYRDDPEKRARYFPEHQSTLVDDAMARAEIMRKVVCAGLKGYLAVPDNYPLPSRLVQPELSFIEHRAAL